MASNIVVTGGAGFIGANLVRSLLTRGHRVRIVDDFSEGKRDYLDGLDVEVFEGSVTSQSLVTRVARSMDSLVHLAAMSGVSPSISNPRRDFNINVLGTFNVLNAARIANVSRVLLASSGAVVAGAEPPLTESIVPRPLSPYGASKSYAEVALGAFGNVYGFGGIGLRFSNVYGPYCCHKTSVIPSFLRSALGKQPLVVYGSGKQTRDFVYVDDVVDAILRALESSWTGTLQLGSGTETSILSLARLVAEAAHVELPIRHAPPRPGDAERNFADNSLAQTILGWRPVMTLARGLTLTHAWVASNCTRT